MAVVYHDPHQGHLPSALPLTYLVKVVLNQTPGRLEISGATIQHFYSKMGKTRFVLHDDSDYFAGVPRRRFDPGSALDHMLASQPDGMDPISIKRLKYRVEKEVDNEEIYSFYGTGVEKITGRQLKIEMDTVFDRYGDETVESQKILDKLSKAFLSTDSVFVSQVNTLPMKRQLDVFYHTIKDQELYPIESGGHLNNVYGYKFKARWLDVLSEPVDHEELKTLVEITKYILNR